MVARERCPVSDHENKGESFLSAEEWKAKAMVIIRGSVTQKVGRKSQAG